MTDDKNIEPRDALPAGHAAEERVAALYRSLGFTVTRDVMRLGSQIDLLAEQQIGGMGPMRICIEVKDHPVSALPIQEVRDFASNARLLLGADRCEQVHLVTTGTITKNSRDVVDSVPHTRLLTYEELERELFAPDPALNGWLASYYSTPINKTYVEIRATLIDFDSPRKVEAPGRVKSSELLSVAARHPQSAVVLLADYGAGKSTALERVKAKAIEQRQIEPTHPVPVLIRLRDLLSTSNIEHIALDAVRSELGLNLPPSTFWSLLRSGRFLMLLDGFDEITLRATKSTRAELLSGISPLLFDYSPAILTSRPSYFASLDEYQGMLNKSRSTHAGDQRTSAGVGDGGRLDMLVSRLADRYHATGPTSPRDPDAISYRLDPLSSEQIDEYLALVGSELASANTDPVEVRQFLDSIYDLSDLITRPIILDMAVVAILEGQINPRESALANGPAGLYEAYTRVQLERDWQNIATRRSLLSYGARMKFAEECALEMQRSEALKIEPKDLELLVQGSISESVQHDLEEVLTDLRTCSFLTVDDDGALEFIHRSYQEFFVARRLRQDLDNGSTARLREPLRWEYLYFLGAFGFTDNDFYQTLTELSRARDDDPARAAIAENASQAMLVARETARHLDWRHRAMNTLRRPRLTIEDSKLQDVRILDVSSKELRLVDCQLDIEVTGNRIRELALTRCNGSIHLAGRIESFAITEGKLHINDRTFHPQVEADSVELDYFALGEGPKKVTIRSATGRLTLQHASVQIARSRLEIVAPEAITGEIRDSEIAMSLDSFDNLAVTLTNSIFIVSGRRTYQKAGQVTRRARRVTHSADSGARAILVVDPSVSVDNWWSQQRDLITIGADLGGSTTDLAGLFVRHTPDMQSSRDALRVVELGPMALVITGSGNRFERTLEEIRGLTHVQESAAATWIVPQFRSLLRRLSAPQAVVDALASEIAARVATLP